jgi:hypothetical protein
MEISVSVLLDDIYEYVGSIIVEIFLISCILCHIAGYYMMMESEQN